MNKNKTIFCLKCGFKGETKFYYDLKKEGVDVKSEIHLYFCDDCSSMWKIHVIDDHWFVSPIHERDLEYHNNRSRLGACYTIK